MGLVRELVVSGHVSQALRQFTMELPRTRIFVASYEERLYQLFVGCQVVVMSHVSHHQLLGSLSTAAKQLEISPQLMIGLIIFL